jgi:hypothetical protein
VSSSDNEYSQISLSEEGNSESVNDFDLYDHDVSADSDSQSDYDT